LISKDKETREDIKKRAKQQNIRFDIESKDIEGE